MPYKGSSVLDPDAVICPGGPTLFQMLKPGFMLGSYHCPPEDLPILHELLQMSSHSISDAINMSNHNGEDYIDKGHEGHILVGGMLPIWGENKLTRQYNRVDCCCVGSIELARCYPWPPPGLRLPLALLLPTLIIISGVQERCVRRPPVVFDP